LLALAGTVFAALATIQIRRLHRTEQSTTIVIYFTLFSALVALLTLPFGWKMPEPGEAMILVATGIFGGMGQVFMTQSLRYADVSILAPFDYLSLIWALIVGFLLFGTLPSAAMLTGSAIVVGAGLFVFYRERRLGIAGAESGSQMGG